MFLLGTAPASADLITFTGAPLGLLADYEESGFKFWWPPGFGDQPMVFDAGGGNLALKDSKPTNMYGSPVVVQRPDGHDFTLDAIQGANFGMWWGFGNIWLDGYHHGVLVAHKTFTPGSPPFQSLDLRGSFEGVRLESLQIHMRSFNGRDYAVDNIEMTVINEPPDCSGAAPSVDEIWPPNHKFVDVNIVGVTDLDGDPITITITNITQDEPVNTLGNGNFEPDGGGLGTSTAQVRAERSGSKKVPGNGRVYEISFTADDGKGGECSASVTVCVPHDQRNGHACFDDGQLYNSATGGIPKLNAPADEVASEATLPEGYELLQNHPNPFNPTTEITFALPEASEVTLTIYNSFGQVIRTLVSGQLSAGHHTVTWNATDASGMRVASGVYMYVLKAGDVVMKNKMLLMK